MPIIFLTVTNDLTYDQRMMRICDSLSRAGYQVTLVGRNKKNSAPLVKRNYNQYRINCIFERGKQFYAEYNIRLFFYLLFKRIDCICAIDLDTIIPSYYISRFKRVERVIDSHEYFTQQKEVVTRDHIYRFWHKIETRFLPKFSNGYTVSESISNAFKENYKLDHAVIRNLPLSIKPLNKTESHGKKIILYQGAINEARGLEYLIPAMSEADAELHMYGEGNFLQQAKEIVQSNNLQHKVFIHQPLIPEALHMITSKAYIGVNLVENIGLNQYYSLANKFFDLIQHEVPQVTTKAVTNSIIAVIVFNLTLTSLFYLHHLMALGVV